MQRAWRGKTTGAETLPLSRDELGALVGTVAGRGQPVICQMWQTFLSFHSIIIIVAIVVLIRSSKWLFKSNLYILQEAGSEKSSPLSKVTQQRCRAPTHNH